MLEFTLFCVSIIMWILLWHFHKPEASTVLQESPSTDLAERTGPRTFFQRSLHFFGEFFHVISGNYVTEEPDIRINTEDIYTSFPEICSSLSEARFSDFHVVYAIDLSASNEWQGRESGGSLHRLGQSIGASVLGKLPGSMALASTLTNPYQKALLYANEALKPFINGCTIMAFGYLAEEVSFNITNPDKSLSDNPFVAKNTLNGAVPSDELIRTYNNLVHRLYLGGPTSLKGPIEQGCSILEKEYATDNKNIYKKPILLIIITDGQLDSQTYRLESSQAIHKASNFPMAISILGLGDGPFVSMDNFSRRLLKRRFDNVHFSPVQNIVMGKGGRAVESMGLSIMMEFPAQFAKMKELNMLDL